MSDPTKTSLIPGFDLRGVVNHNFATSRESFIGILGSIYQDVLIFRKIKMVPAPSNGVPIEIHKGW